MRLFITGLAVALAVNAPDAGERILIDDFEDVTAWSHNPDGGVRSTLSRETRHVRSGESAMRIEYEDAPPHWSNQRRALRLPSTSGFFDLWIYKESAEPKAAMHLWLFEPDGDGYVTRLLDDGSTFGKWARGWHHIQIPLKSLRFDPRGDKRRNLASVDRMLLGCNFGDIAACVDHLYFVRGEEARMAPGQPRVYDDGLIEVMQISLDEDAPLNLDRLGQGWWDPEPHGTWSGRGRLPAEVVFSARPGRDYLVTYFDARVLCARMNGACDVRFTLNGEVLQSVRATTERNTFRVPIPSERLLAGENRLAISAPTLVPKEIGEADDPRTLGVKVARIEVASYVRTSKDVSRTPRGSIAVWRDDVPVRGAASDPEHLARLLKDAGYGVTFVSTADLLSPAFLTRDNFDLLVLPYGASYPAHGKDALCSYLSHAGRFFSMGGYAFDNPLVRINGKWVDERSVYLALPGASIDIGADGDEAYLVGDWHDRESGGREWGAPEGSVTVRWTTGRSGVRVPVDPDRGHTMKIAMCFRDAQRYATDATGKAVTTGRVLVNGEQVGDFEGEAGVVTLEFPVPRRVLKGKPEAEVWLLSDTWTPSDVFSSSDKRRLGVAVNWIKFIPQGSSEAHVQPSPAEFDVHINTRKGEPRDSLRLSRDQIGVFDPSYPLLRATTIRAAPALEYIAPNARAVALRGDFTGWCASSMTASNSPVFPEEWGIRTPLFEAYDAYGRPRGSVGAMVRNHSGPYAGSTWVYFGVDNVDVFDPRNRKMARAFLDIVESAMQDVYIERAEADFASYRIGETASTSVTVRNQTPDTRTLELVHVVAPVRSRAERQTGRPAQERRFITVPAHGHATAIFTYELPARPSDLYKVTVGLLDSDGQPIDKRDTGFVVWNDEVVRSGINLRWRDNYFWDGDRQLFLTGTNQTGMMFYSADENPLVWDRDFAQMRDNNVNVMRVLHFSPFVGEGRPPRASPLDLARPMPERLARQLDAIIQLSQKHKVSLFLSLHDWMPVDLSDAELEAQRAFAEQIAARYKAIPGPFFDVQNEPTVGARDIPDLRRLWNDFLRDRYGTDDALRAAWGEEAPAESLGDIPVASGRNEWRSVKSADYSRFKNVLLNRWVGANVAGSKAGDPDRLITVGYLPWMWNADKLVGQEHCDFSNMHDYVTGSAFPREFKLTDRRFEGKGLSLGEFGAKVHPTWGAASNPDAFVGVTRKQAELWFLRLSHYTLGLGGSMLCNWDWKDMTGCVFPWGVVHPGDGVPKDDLRAFRDISLLFRQFQYAYEAPEVYVLVPDEHRMGASEKPVTNAAMALIDVLIGLHVPFNVINESSLDSLPPTARVMLWPVPFCPTDETYGRVRRFVEGGGMLWVSGDVSYDVNRKRTKTERLRELCGVEFVREFYPDIQWQKATAQAFPNGLDVRYQFAPRPCIEVALAGGKQLLPVAGPFLIEHTVGRGKVWYVTDPLELHPEPGQRGLYAAFLKAAGVEREPIKPDDPNLHVFRLPTRDGGQVWVLYNNNPEKSLDVTIRTLGGKVALHLASKRPGFIGINGSGSVVAVEAQGDVTLGGRSIASADGHFMALTLDGASLMSSKQVLAVGFDECSLRVAPARRALTVGQIVGGRWRTYETVKAVGAGEPVAVDADRRLSLMLLTAPGAAQSAIHRVERLSSLDW
ncbi:MAG: beta-galactosidase [Armatimonadota bacterium]